MSLKYFSLYLILFFLFSGLTTVKHNELNFEGETYSSLEYEISGQSDDESGGLNIQWDIQFLAAHHAAIVKIEQQKLENKILEYQINLKLQSFFAVYFPQGPPALV